MIHNEVRASDPYLRARSAHSIKPGQGAHYLFPLLAAVLLAAGCPVQTADAPRSTSDGPLRIVATTGMVADMVRNVAGEQAEVTALMGPGVDPHLYRASEGDVRALTEADAVFYNGLHLEAKLADLLDQLGERKVTVALAEAIPETSLLGDDSGSGGTYDPHVWFDVAIWKLGVPEVVAALSKLDPEHAQQFEQRGQVYTETLDALDAEVREQIEQLPPERRVLVTAHDAFRYFGKAYGFEVIGLQGISTVSEAGTADVQQLAELIAKRRIPAIFVESSVPVRNIEAVQAAVRARDWDVAIGGELYSDALGDAGSEAGTYVGMVRGNVETIISALVESRKSKVEGDPK